MVLMTMVGWDKLIFFISAFSKASAHAVVAVLLVADADMFENLNEGLSICGIFLCNMNIVWYEYMLYTFYVFCES